MKYGAGVCIVIDAPVDVSWQDFVPASTAQHPSGVYLTQSIPEHSGMTMLSEI